MLESLRGRRTQFYVDVLYGVLFLASFAYLTYDITPTAVGFAGGLVVGYFLHVWEKMVTYERILEDSVSAEAERQVSTEVDEQVGDIQTEVEERVTAEMDDVDARIEERVGAEVGEAVPDDVREMDDVGERVEREVEETVTDEVEEKVEEKVEQSVEERVAEKTEEAVEEKAEEQVEERVEETVSEMVDDPDTDPDTDPDDGHPDRPDAVGNG